MILLKTSGTLINSQVLSQGYRQKIMEDGRREAGAGKPVPGLRPPVPLSACPLSPVPGPHKPTPRTRDADSLQIPEPKGLSAILALIGYHLSNDR